MIWYKDNSWLYIEKNKFLWIKESFETKNLQKIQKKNMGFYGWQKMPDIIKHYKDVWEYVKVPLWFYGFRYSLFENKTEETVSIEYPKINWELRPDQVTAINSILSSPTWLLHASTWVWKTYMIAGIIKHIWKKTLIVCDSIGRMTQMQDDIYEILWIQYQTLSWKKTKKNSLLPDNIVIANIDSVTKQERCWVDNFWIIIIDEADRALQSDNRRKWVWNLSPNNLYWLTGTIKLNHIEDKVFPLYLWPKTELLEKNFIPDIHIVYTDFEYSDWQLEDMKDFHKLKEELYTNESRNNLIVETILTTLKWRKWIVFTEYIDHAKLLQQMLEENNIKTFLIIWEITGEMREEIRKQIIQHQWACVLIWSKVCIGRWFNVPELSVGYLTVTEKFTSSIEQYIGRIIRKFTWKNHADWYDFTDVNVNILSNQWKNRITTYKREFKGCKIFQYFTNTL